MRTLLASAQARAHSVPAQAMFHLSATCFMANTDENLGESAANHETNETGETGALASLLAAYSGLLAVPGLPPPLVLMPPLDVAAVAPVPEIRVGFGQAACLQPQGPDRLTRLAQDGQALLSALIDLRSSDAQSAPAPCLYGALQFQPLPATAASTTEPTATAQAAGAATAWAGLPDAHFVLPRWLLRLRGRQGFLQLAVRACELADPTALLAELALIEAALQRPSPADPVVTAAQAAGAVAAAGADAQAAAAWRDLVGQALDQIAQGALDKVVLARVQTAQRGDGQGFDVATALRQLGQAYPACLRFALPLADATFLGATPELLVERIGDTVRCDALAGSRPWLATGESAEQAGQALLADDKEAREHAYVVAAIRDRLQVHGALTASRDPTLRVLRNVVHLWTPVSATLRQPVHILALLADLHPTPAVCGVPQAAAAAFIVEREALPRGYYAAPIGWFDAQGHGAFFVAIRSALLRGDRAWLFAGAGIVAGSDPDRELRETAAKLRPMLGALGLSDPVPQRIRA